MGALCRSASNNADLLDADPSDIEAAFHFIEFGLEKGHYGRPTEIDANFVRETHGLKVDGALPPLAALARLREMSGRGVLDRLVLTPDDLWVEAGIPAKPIAASFDHEFYRAAVRASGADAPPASRGACIGHFIREGQDRLVRFNAGLSFDPAFYVETYADRLVADGLDPRHSEPAELHRHWIRKGMARGFASDLRSWARARFSIDVPPMVLEIRPVYAAHCADLGAAPQQHTVLQHLIETAGPGLAYIDIGNPEMVGFLTAIADRFAIKGADDLAERIYLQVLQVDGLRGPALRHLADLFQRRGQSEMSQYLREHLYNSEETKDIWTYVILSEAYERKGSLLRAAEILRQGREAFPGNVDLRQRARRLGQAAFEQVWSRVADAASAAGVDHVKAHLRRAVALCCDEPTSIARAEPVQRVALVGNRDLPQCNLYRIEQKREHLQAAGYDVVVFDVAREANQFVERIAEFQAVIFFRVAAFPHVIEAIEAARVEGLLTFYEIDDLVFDEALFPPPFSEYEGQLDRRNYDAMACGVPLFDSAMTLCDYGIASTRPLVAPMRQRVRKGEVFVHRNALGRKHMLSIRGTEARGRRTNGPVRIFYGSGTRAHKQDFRRVLEPALAAIAAKHRKKIEIVLVGHFADLDALQPHRDRVTVMEPIWDFEEYCELLSTIDINTSVLERSPLTDAKSEIKWLEAAMLEIPSVVSRTAVHDEVIRDGETGILCETRSDFENALNRLIGDPRARAKMGRAAKADVMERYSIEAQGQNLRTMFETLRPPQRQRKRRLLVVNVFYPPQAIGGATRVVHDNVRDLSAAFGDRFEIDVVCSLEGGRAPYQVSRYGQDGVRVWAISTPDDPDIDKVARDDRMGEIFSGILAQVEPDLVHFHCIQRLTASVVDAARMACIPYIITAHDAWWISPHQFLLDPKDDAAKLYDFRHAPGSAKEPRVAALKRPLLGAEHVLGVSEPFTALYLEAGVASAIAVPNGVPPLPPVRRVPSDSGRVRLAHIGGMSRHKGYHLVRDALASQDLKNLELTVIDHSMNEGAVRRDRWGGTEVTFLPKVRQDRVADLYARIDVLLAPSVWPESYGLVAREALHAGAWVVASDRGAIGADVVPGCNGFVVSVDGGYEALAAVLARIDAEPQTYLSPSTTPSPLRSSMDQARDLAALYERILSQQTG